MDVRWLLCVAIALLLAGSVFGQDELKQIPPSAVVVARYQSINDNKASLTAFLRAATSDNKLTGDEIIDDLYKSSPHDLAVAADKRSYEIWFWHLPARPTPDVIRSPEELPVDSVVSMCAAKDDAALRRYLVEAKRDEQVDTKQLPDGIVELRHNGKDASFYTPLPVYLFQRDGWSFSSQSLAAVKEFVEHDPQNAKPWADQLDPLARRQFLSKHASFAVNLAPWLASQEPAMRDAQREGRAEIDKLSFGDEESEWSLIWRFIDAKKFEAVAKHTLHQSLESGVDALLELQSVSGHMAMDAEGLTGELIVSVKPGGIVDRWLQSAPPQKWDLVDRLPVGASMYFAQHGLPSAEQLIGNSLVSVLPDSEDTRKWQASQKLLKTAQPGATALAVFRPVNDDSGLETVKLLSAGNIAALRSYIEMTTPREHDDDDSSTKTVCQAGSEKLDGRPVDVVTQEHKFAYREDLLDDILQTFQKQISGAKRYQLRQVESKGMLLRVGGTDRKRFENRVFQVESADVTAGDQIGLKTARNQLGEEVNVVLLFQVSRLVAFLDRTRYGDNVCILDLWHPSDEWPQLRDTPGYSGFSLSTGPAQLRGRFFMPPDNLHAAELKAYSDKQANW